MDHGHRYSLTPCGLCMAATLAVLDDLHARSEAAWAGYRATVAEYGSSGPLEAPEGRSPVAEALSAWFSASYRYEGARAVLEALRKI